MPGTGPEPEREAGVSGAPTIGIVIPNHNNARFLDEAIRSALD